MNRGRLVGLLTLWLLCINSYSAQAQFVLKQGVWRGILYYRSGVELPFTLSIEGTQITQKAYFLNGAERYQTDKIEYRNDSVFISIDQFENELALKVTEPGRLSGLYRKQDDRRIPTLDAKGLPLPAGSTSLPILVTLEHGKTYRFTPNAAKPSFNLTGKWDIAYQKDDGTETRSVGIFKQEGTGITGTILNASGDSRYLQGDVDGNTVGLSSFIGTSPTLLTGNILDSNTITGRSVSPLRSVNFRANRNEKAALPDAYSLTQLKQGLKAVQFKLTDMNGKSVSPDDEKLKDKPFIITISGTWCPNCMDEIAFLAPWYKQNRARGIEVVTVYFERKADQAYIMNALNRVKEKYGIEYLQLAGGTADNTNVLRALPFLQNFKAFPTTIFVDRSGNITKVHTGFNGPATGKYFEEFKTEFNAEVDRLLAK